jgi:hypothetical protein
MVESNIYFKFLEAQKAGLNIYIIDKRNINNINLNLNYLENVTKNQN